MKTVNIQPSNLGQFFEQNVLYGYIISPLDYYNFKVHITFPQLRTEQSTTHKNCAPHQIHKALVMRNSGMKKTT